MALGQGIERTEVRELASGVDALYLSGRSTLTPEVEAPLADARRMAEETDEPVSFDVGGVELWVEPRSFGRYRYRLVHPAGLIGVTPSATFPTLRVQPFAEFLHGVGPTEVLRFFDDVLGFLLGEPIVWSLSRLDLFCDVQGWLLVGDDRHRFTCRAASRHLHEHGATFGGFEFGRRKTKTVCARIYDKTRQVEEKGLDWWPDIWGDRFDRRIPVLRVEFEVGRQGLKEYGIDSPVEGLARVGDVWASVSSSWLSYRTPTDDDTRSRWPIAPEWTAIQQASLRAGAEGYDRVRAGRRRGEIRRLMPPFVGYLARLASLTGADDLLSALGAVRHYVDIDEQRRGVSFEDRVAALVAAERRR